MKRITEAQIRQVIREEIAGLLNEVTVSDVAQIENKVLRDYLVKLAMNKRQAKRLASKNKLTSEDEKIDNYLTQPEIFFINMADKNKEQKQSIKCSNLSGRCTVEFYNGENKVELLLPQEVVKRLKDEGKFNEFSIPPANPKTSYDKPLDTSGTIAGLPKDLPRPNRKA